MILALMFCFTGVAIAHITPEKPNPAKKLMTYAEEIVEYEDDIIVENGNVLEDISDKTEICICVVGNASKLLSPDSATIFASVSSCDSDISIAKNTNNEKFQNIISTLDELGVSKDNISLDDYNTMPRFSFSFTNSLTEYCSSLRFSVKVDNLDNLNEIITALNENVNINDIRYEVSNLDEEYTNVLNLAVENAKSKAIALAGREDLNISCIKEERLFSKHNIFKRYSETLEDSSLLGKIEIKARVNVEFE